MAQSGYAKPATVKHRPRKASPTDFRPNVPWERATEDERRDFAAFYINQATESSDVALLQTRLHYYLRRPDPDYFLLARMLVNFEEYLPPKEHFALIVAVLTAQVKRDSRYMAALLLVLRLIAINGYGAYGWQAGKEVKIVGPAQATAITLLRQWQQVFTQRLADLKPKGRVEWLVDAQGQLADCCGDELARLRWNMAATAISTAVDLALCPPNPQLPLDFLSGEWAQTCRHGVEALQAAWCDLPPTMREELEQQIVRGLKIGNPTGIKIANYWLRAKLLAQLCGVPDVTIEQVIARTMPTVAATDPNPAPAK